MRISDWSSDVCSSDLSEKVELIDSSGQLSVTLDSSGGKIVVRAGGGDVEIVADGKLTMTAPEIEMNAQNGITMNGGTGVTVSAAQIELNLGGNAMPGMPAAQEGDTVFAINMHLLQPPGPTPPDRR